MPRIHRFMKPLATIEYLAPPESRLIPRQTQSLLLEEYSRHERAWPSGLGHKITDDARRMLLTNPPSLTTLFVRPRQTGQTSCRKRPTRIGPCHSRSPLLQKVL